MSSPLGRKGASWIVCLTWTPRPVSFDLCVAGVLFLVLSDLSLLGTVLGGLLYKALALQSTWSHGESTGCIS